MNKKSRNPINKLKAFATALSAGIMTLPATSFAFNSYGGATSQGIMDGVKQFIGNIGTWGGGIYAVFAIFTLILAIRNEDNEGRNKAALNLLAAIALLSTGVIIQLFFN